MSKIITLSGWGMAHDSLSAITPDGTTHIDYSNFESVETFFDSIKNQNPDVVIGWSLGGQLALRAISEDILKPKTLILLAAPYQFVSSKEIRCAMDRDTFNLFHNSFQNDPVKTIKRFITLISLNDSHIHEILTKLRQAINIEHAIRWIYWLEQLESFSCNTIDFSKIPKTLAVYGRDDTIVDFAQTGLFRSLIKDYTLEVFEACGHAPHLHNEDRVKEIIKAAL